MNTQEPGATFVPPRGAAYSILARRSCFDSDAAYRKFLEELAAMDCEFARKLLNQFNAHVRSRRTT